MSETKKPAALAEQPAGPDAEPVAWRWLYNGSPDSEKCFPMPGPDADVIAKAGASEFPRTVQYLYTAAPEAPKPAKPAEQEPVAWCDQYESHIDGLRHYSDGGAREIPLYTAPNLVRAQTLEEAALVCEEVCDDPHVVLHVGTVCAAAIRLLKEKT